MIFSARPKDWHAGKWKIYADACGEAALQKAKPSSLGVHFHAMKAADAWETAYKKAIVSGTSDQDADENARRVYRKVLQADRSAARAKDDSPVAIPVLDGF